MTTKGWDIDKYTFKAFNQQIKRGGGETFTKKGLEATIKVTGQTASQIMNSIRVQMDTLNEVNRPFAKEMGLRKNFNAMKHWSKTGQNAAENKTTITDEDGDKYAYHDGYAIRDGKMYKVDEDGKINKSTYLLYV